MLTGYADVQNTMEAVNGGNIFGNIGAKGQGCSLVKEDQKWEGLLHIKVMREFKNLFY